MFISCIWKKFLVTSYVILDLFLERNSGLVIIPFTSNAILLSHFMLYDTDNLYIILCLLSMAEFVAEVPSNEICKVACVEVTEPLKGLNDSKEVHTYVEYIMPHLHHFLSIYWFLSPTIWRQKTLRTFIIYNIIFLLSPYFMKYENFLLHSLLKPMVRANITLLLIAREHEIWRCVSYTSRNGTRQGHLDLVSITINREVLHCINYLYVHLSIEIFLFPTPHYLSFHNSS